MTAINTGLSAIDRETVAKGLSLLLADSYTLYLKTHNFHWNVTGPQFNSLHLLFETQYIELADAVDEIAERIRALGFHAPGSYADFSKLTSIKEATGNTAPKAEVMLEQLVADQETVIRTARTVFPQADAAKDQATVDLVTRRIEIHEKNAWMLRSQLG